MSLYRHILAPIDIKVPERGALERAVRLAGQYGARLTLLHVIEHFPEDLPVEVIPPENVDPERALLDRARRRLEQLRDESGYPDAQLHVMTSTGAARAEVVDYARDHGVGLIVVGAHREGRHLPGLGSTSAALVGHAPCDVLVVKPTGA